MSLIVEGTVNGARRKSNGSNDDSGKRNILLYNLLKKYINILNPGIGDLPFPSSTKINQGIFFPNLKQLMGEVGSCDSENTEQI